MALENAIYINDLVGTNPVAADPKSQGDDHIRLVKTAVKQTLNGFPGAILLTATDTGTAAAHVLTPATALVGYTPMLCLLYLPAVTNTGAITVNVSGLGVRSIKTLAGADPTAGDIVAGQPVLLMYGGTNFVTLAGSEFLSKTGNQTLTGNLTLAGGAAISAGLTVAGTTGLQSATGLTLAPGNSSTNLSTTGFVTAAVAAEALIRGNADALLAPLASPTLTGTPTAPTAAPGTSSTQIATMAALATAAFSAVLPSQTGNAGKFVTTDGSVASWVTVPSPSVIRSVRTANTIIGVADRTTLIDITSGTFTQTFGAVANLADGWFAYLRNSGAGDITLDPSGTELIDGLTSYVMYPGECRLVQCDGVALRSVVLSPFSKAFTASGTLIRPPGYAIFSGLLWAGGGSGGKGVATFSKGGGGGGACVPFSITAAQIGASQSVTIAAGGAAVTTDAAGNLGGNSSIGTIVLSYGGGGGGAAGQRGGGGGGALSAGTSGAAGTGAGGLPGPGALVANLQDNTGFGGGGWVSPSNSAYGGGSGGADTAAGRSVYGGGGGGGISDVSATLPPGTSVFGGAGGAANLATSGAAGVAPGGGGGATITGASTGAGGAGELRIWGIA